MLEYWGCPLLVLQVQLYDLSQLANAKLSVKIITVKGKDRRFITGRFSRQDRKIIVILANTCRPDTVGQNIWISSFNAFYFYLMIRFRHLFLVVLSCVLVSSCGEPEQGTATNAPEQPRDYSALNSRLDSIIGKVQANVGVAVISIPSGDTFSYHAHQRFPMFSTYKFPLALKVLKLVDQGKLRLDQEVVITTRELARYNHGIFLETHSTGKDITITVDSMIWYTMAYSDNVTCDKLFEIAGGPSAVHDYISGLGISGIEIRNTVTEMNSLDAYKHNWCRPMAMTRLLAKFYNGDVVSDSNRSYLLQYMEAAPTGANRLPGKLPAGTTVAHKTGTGGTRDGVTQGCNDVGIISLPDGLQLAVSIYLSDVRLPVDSAAGVIADIARAIYDDAAR